MKKPMIALFLLLSSCVTTSATPIRNLVELGCQEARDIQLISEFLLKGAFLLDDEVNTEVGHALEERIATEALKLQAVLDELNLKCSDS